MTTRKNLHSRIKKRTIRRNSRVKKTKKIMKGGEGGEGGRVISRHVRFTPSTKGSSSSSSNPVPKNIEPPTHNSKSSLLSGLVKATAQFLRLGRQTPATIPANEPEIIPIPEFPSFKYHQESKTYYLENIDNLLSNLKTYVQSKILNGTTQNTTQNINQNTNQNTNQLDKQIIKNKRKDYMDKLYNLIASIINSSKKNKEEHQDDNIMLQDANAIVSTITAMIKPDAKPYTHQDIIDNYKYFLENLNNPTNISTKIAEFTPVGQKDNLNMKNLVEYILEGLTERLIFRYIDFVIQGTEPKQTAVEEPQLTAVEEPQQTAVEEPRQTAVDELNKQIQQYRVDIRNLKLKYQKYINNRKQASPSSNIVGMVALKRATGFGSKPYKQANKNSQNVKQQIQKLEDKIKQTQAEINRQQQKDKISLPNPQIFGPKYIYKNVVNQTTLISLNNAQKAEREKREQQEKREQLYNNLFNTNGPYRNRSASNNAHERAQQITIAMAI